MDYNLTAIQSASPPDYAMVMATLEVAFQLERIADCLEKNSTPHHEFAVRVYQTPRSEDG